MLDEHVLRLFETALARWQDETLAALRGARRATKADEPAQVGGSGPLRERVDAVVAALDLDLTAVEQEALENALQEAAKDSALRAFAQVGVGLGDAALTGPAPTAAGIGDEIWVFDRINQRAVAWAQEHAGDLVSQVSDTTRAAVRSAVADGMAGGERFYAIIARVEAHGVFDQDRAALIGETELAAANSQGALIGFKQARERGVQTKKAWLTAGGLERICVVCRGNEAEGAIDLDDDFSSGDAAPPAHPRCRCVLTVVVDEKTTKMDRSYSSPLPNEDRKFRSSFDKMFGKYLNRRTQVEREFDAATERLKVPGPLEKLSPTPRRREFFKAIRADQRNIRRAADAMGALIKQIEADVANLEAQKAREMKEH